MQNRREKMRLECFWSQKKMWVVCWLCARKTGAKSAKKGRREFPRQCRWCGVKIPKEKKAVVCYLRPNGDIAGKDVVTFS